MALTEEKNSTDTEETIRSENDASESKEETQEQDPILEAEREATESIREESLPVDGSEEPGGNEPSEQEVDELFLSPDEEEDELFLSPDDDEGEVIDLSAPEEASVNPGQEELEELRAALERERAARADLQTRVDSLQGAAQALEEEKEEINNRLLRSVADLENYRRRTEREKEELKKYGIEKVLADLVPAVDNMERALAHAQEQGENSSLVEGIGMVYRQILGALKKYGVQPFASKGEPFDPQRHEAIQQVESTEYDTGTIVEEYQKGYFIHERLLRPALVVVAKRVQPPQNQETEDEQEELGDAETASGEDAGEAEGSVPEAGEREEEAKPRSEDEQDDGVEG